MRIGPNNAQVIRALFDDDQAIKQSQELLHDKGRRQGRPGKRMNAAIVSEVALVSHAWLCPVFDRA